MRARMSAVIGGAMLTAAAAATWLTAAGAHAADHPGGSAQACQAYAQAAIERHQVITGTPAACRGLSRAQVSQAARDAIRATLTRGTKAATRKQAGAASVWVRALITYTPPSAAGPSAAAPAGPPPAGGAGGPGTGELGLGVSRLGARLGALLAWLAAAASGGLVLVRWLLAGGRPLRGSSTAAPPAVILGHVGAGAFGLVLWASFMLSGWTPLAWTALALLAPVAGLGLGVLLLGLPAPARRQTGRRGRIPVLAIAAHGLFAVTALLLVLMATVGAG